MKATYHSLEGAQEESKVIYIDKTKSGVIKIQGGSFSGRIATLKPFIYFLLW